MTKVYGGNVPLEQSKSNLGAPTGPHQSPDPIPIIFCDPDRLPDVLAALEQAPTDGKPSDVSTVDLLVRFEDEVLTDQSAYTVRTHQSALLRLAHWLQPRTLVQATAANVSDWLDTLTLNAKDLEEQQTVIYRFYEWLLAEGLILKNPSVRPFHLHQPVIAGELAQWLDGWRRERERREVSPNTIARETNLLVDFHSFMSPKSMIEASPEDIYSWLDSHGRGSLPLAANTRKGYVCSLSSFYRWAVRAHLTEFDPTEDVVLPRRARLVPRPISDRDLALALQLANPTIRAILSLAAFCGLRAQEIAGLRREDIVDHLDPPVLVVRKPKGHRERTVPLHPQAWSALKEILPPSGSVLTLKMRQKYSIEWNQQHAGRPWQAPKVSTTANRYLASLGIHSSLHTLRHWYATRVYAVSMDLRLTQELLGHVDPEATVRYAGYNKTKAYDAIRQLTLVDPDPNDSRTFIMCEHCGSRPRQSNSTALCGRCRAYKRTHEGRLPALDKPDAASDRVAAAVQLLGADASRLQLAALAGVHRNTVVRSIRGDRRPFANAAKRAEMIASLYRTGTSDETPDQVAQRMPERIRDEYLRLVEQVSGREDPARASGPRGGSPI